MAKQTQQLQSEPAPAGHRNVNEDPITLSEELELDVDDMMRVIAEADRKLAEERKEEQPAPSGTFGLRFSW